jgi:hypothetical protein
MFPHSGATLALSRILDGLELELKLYTEVVGGIVKETVASDFVEATFPGYIFKALRSELWHPPRITGDQTYSEYRLPQVFTRTSTGASESLLGYYVVTVEDGTLLYAESFGQEVPLTLVNDSIEFTPKIYLR